MPAANLDLDGDRVIEQGSFWMLDILYPGNASGAMLRGQIRKDYGDDLLAEFRSGQAVYDEETNKTRLTILLNASTTAKIPVPNPNEFWRYDVLFTAPGTEPRRLVQGKVYVSPGVTTNARN